MGERREGRGGEKEGREKRKGKGRTCSKVLGGIDAPACQCFVIKAKSLFETVSQSYKSCEYLTAVYFVTSCVK